MSRLKLPLLNKWACIYSVKGGARCLDMIEIFGDGSFRRFPYATINLDSPLVLLNPESDRNNPTRPSNIARACDLLPDPQAYGLLRLAEEHIIEGELHRPTDALFFTIAVMDGQYSPTQINVLEFSEAMAQLKAAKPSPSAAPKFNRT